MSASPWATLGIGPTADQLAIRRAYSRRLKVIDPEENPAAFHALREAYDWARAYAGRVGDGAPAPMAEAPQPADTADVAADTAAAAPVASAAPEQAGPERDSEKPQWIDDIEAIQTLIDGTATREEIYDEVQARTERLLTSPEMLSVNHAGAIERWTAETILGGIPRTNGMLGPAVDHFRWAERAERWDCPPAILQVLQRRDDARYLGHLHETDDPMVRAFRLLQRPDIDPAPRDSRLVAQFLAIVRLQHPSVQADLSPEAIRKWDACEEKRRSGFFPRLLRLAGLGLATAGHVAARSHLDLVVRFLFLAVAIAVAALLVIPTHGFSLLFLIPLIGRAVARN